jgi:uncharacterized protein
VSAPAAGGGKRCTVVYAHTTHALRWQLELPAHASIGDALAAARALAGAAGAAIPWEAAAVGVFGELRQRAQPFADGDRIELYRELAADPRERRRARVQQQRRQRR